MRRGVSSVSPRRGRRGVTLLELVMAGTLAATLMATAHAVLRSVQSASDQLGRENDVLHHADQALRFMTRRCREARGVAGIFPGHATGRVDLAVDGGTLRFDRAGVGDAMIFRDTRVDNGGFVFAEYVTGFTPVFYAGDAVTPTADPAQARLIELTLTVDLPRDHLPERTVSGRVWVRPW